MGHIKPLIEWKTTTDDVDIYGEEALICSAGGYYIKSVKTLLNGVILLGLTARHLEKYTLFA